MTPENQELLLEGIERLGLRSHPGQLAALAAYHDALLATTHAGLNLTGIRDERESVVRNLLDALAGWLHLGDPEELAEREASLVEVGAGAGVPGIPLAIVLPFSRTVLIESKEKKAAFLREVSEALNEYMAPRSIEVSHADAKTLKVPRRFDRLVCRAYGPLSKIVRMVDRYVAHDGRGLAYKGRRETIERELAELNEAQRNRCEIEPVEVPFMEDVQRHIVRIRPHSKTPRA